LASDSQKFLGLREMRRPSLSDQVTGGQLCCCISNEFDVRFTPESGHQTAWQ
jgi:hypothetical protein